MTDPYPSSDFDDWADTYDQDVVSDSFPFTGYDETLNTVIRLAGAHPGMNLFDLGTGTGNLARRFLEFGCRVTAMDFSSAMLDKARERLPGAVLIRADLRQEFPAELCSHKFERIVSGYVFHHFDLAEKVSILLRLKELLAPGGWLTIADVSFSDRHAYEAVKQAAGDAWDDEFYWIASEAIAMLQESGFAVQYHQVSSCAGVYQITPFEEKLEDDRWPLTANFDF
jgi:putative AdoMet-dependent methyltransferase